MWGNALGAPPLLGNAPCEQPRLPTSSLRAAGRTTVEIVRRLEETPFSVDHAACLFGCWLGSADRRRLQWTTAA